MARNSGIASTRLALLYDLIDIKFVIKKEVYKRNNSCLKGTYTELNRYARPRLP